MPEFGTCVAGISGSQSYTKLHAAYVLAWRENDGLQSGRCQNMVRELAARSRAAGEPALKV
jgi:hypothetical protein